MSRYDFHLSAAAVAVNDPRFSWETHFGGDIDVADYVVGRSSILVDYEAVLGDEFRAFDPNQGNYTLEASSSARVGDTEIAGVFHHVSRHLSDRPEAVRDRVERARRAGPAARIRLRHDDRHRCQRRKGGPELVRGLHVDRRSI